MKGQNTELSLQIYNARKKKNITQNELAKRIGVRRQTIGNWENGKKIPKYGNLRMLCEVLGDGFMSEEILSEVKGTQDKVAKLLGASRIEQKAIASCIRFAAQYDFMCFKGDRIPKDFDRDTFLQKYGYFKEG